MTMMRRRFRAKEARAIENLELKTILDLAIRHQSHKALFVRAPVALSFLYALSIGSVGTSSGSCTY